MAWTQEKRDAAARLMGWDVIVVPYIDDKKSVLKDLRERGYPDEEIVQLEGGYWTTVLAAKWDGQVESLGSSVGVYYGDPKTTTILFGCSWGPTKEWKPDEDPRQALMMRDECARRGLEWMYATNLLALLGHESGSGGSGPNARLKAVAFATTEQMADAAYLTLEAAERAEK